jgi:pimeloyl-[acyl-carrier protein] methyl ester esterase
LDAAIQGEPGPVVVVGWSIGAMVSFEAASRIDAGGLGGLVLISGTLRLANPRALRAMGMQLRRQREKVLTDFAQLCIAQSTSEAGDSDFVARFLEMAGRIETEELVAGLQYLRETDLRSHLSRVAMPVAVVHGQADLVIPCEDGRSLATEIAGASFDMVPDAGHALPFTHPRRIARTILEVIHGCPTAR